MRKSQNRRGGFTLLELIVVLVIMAGFLYLMVSSTHMCGGPEASRRSSCKSSLKQIGIAIHNYHEEFACLPPAYTVDENGIRLHSWRTLILPYVMKSRCSIKSI